MKSRSQPSRLAPPGLPLLLGGKFPRFPRESSGAFPVPRGAWGVPVFPHTKFSLGLHASFYLAAATAVSPLPVYVGNALAGTVPAAPGWNVWIVGVSALLCYLTGARREDRGQRRLLWFVPAVLVGFAGAAILVVAISGSPLAYGTDASRLSVIRTIVNCALALAFGFAGAPRSTLNSAGLPMPRLRSARSSFCWRTCDSAMPHRSWCRFCATDQS